MHANVSDSKVKSVQSIRQHARMNARPPSSKRCHSSLHFRGTRECFETSPHLAYRQCMKGPRLAAPTSTSELTELGGTTICQCQTRRASHVSKHTNIHTNAVWLSGLDCLSLDAFSEGRPWPASGMKCCGQFHRRSDSTSTLLDALGGVPPLPGGSIRAPADLS